MTAKVKLEYLKREFLAKISINQVTDGWHELRRGFELKSEDVVGLNDTEFTIPWFIFLNLTNELKYYLKNYNLSFEAIGEAKVLLQKNLGASNAYTNAISNNIELENVQEKLNELGFQRTLTDKQIRNLKKIGGLPAAATFSVPGAGKTTEALAFYQLNRDATSRLLVVAPKNAFPAWDEQIVECLSSGEEVTRLVGTNQDIIKKLSKIPKFCIINYHKLANCLSIIANYFSEGDNNFMFLDESHRIKRGKDGEHGSAILKLAHLPDKKLIMSGTPMPNSAYDINPQFEFLYPSVKINDYATELIKPIFVRTTKYELHLPKLERYAVEVEMTQRQRELYNLLSKRFLVTAKQNMSSSQKQVLRGIGKSVIRLIQLTSNPSLLLKADIDDDGLLSDILLEGESPKLEYVCNRARHLVEDGKKVLIWSSFVKNVETIATRLSDLGAEYIHGGVDAGDEEDDETREGKIKKFHDDKNCNILVANPAACSEGISLHKVCHHAIYLDRNFNAAQYLQSEDRIHRYGLDKSQITTIEIVNCTDSIDIIIGQRLDMKVSLMSDVLNDPGLSISPVNVNDLENDSLDKEDISSILEQIKRSLE